MFVLTTVVILSVPNGPEEEEEEDNDDDDKDDDDNDDDDGDGCVYSWMCLGEAF